MKVKQLNKLTPQEFEALIDTFPDGKLHGSLLNPKDDENLYKEFEEWAEDSLRSDVFVMEINYCQLYVTSEDAEDLLHIQLRWAN